jgi:hypothetical protein
MGVKVSATVVGLVLAASAVAATKPTILKFSTAVRDSKPVGSDEPLWQTQKLGEMKATIVPDAGQMTNWYYAFPSADQKEFDALNWNTRTSSSPPG